MERLRQRQGVSRAGLAKAIAGYLHAPLTLVRDMLYASPEPDLHDQLWLARRLGATPRELLNWLVAPTLAASITNGVRGWAKRKRKEQSDDDPLKCQWRLPVHLVRGRPVHGIGGHEFHETQETRTGSR